MSTHSILKYTSHQHNSFSSATYNPYNQTPSTINPSTIFLSCLYYMFSIFQTWIVPISQLTLSYCQLPTLLLFSFSLFLQHISNSFQRNLKCHQSGQLQRTRTSICKCSWINNEDDHFYFCFCQGSSTDKTRMSTGLAWGNKHRLSVVRQTQLQFSMQCTGEDLFCVLLDS